MIKQSTTSIKQKSAKNSFSPKQSTIKFLLAFAAAYQVHTTEHGHICDFVLN